MIGTVLSARSRRQTSSPSTLGQHDVEHDEVDVLLGEPPQRLVAVARLDDPVAVALERVREERLDRVLVVDEEDGRGGVRHLRWSATPGRDRLPAPYYSPLHGARPPRHEQAEAAARLGRAPRRHAARPQASPLVLVAAAPARSSLTLGAPRPAARADAAARLRRRPPRLLDDRARERLPEPRRPASLGAAAAAASGSARSSPSTASTSARTAGEEDVPGSARVELRNLATVVPGTLAETIVVVAHRDNNGVSAGRERQRERDGGAGRARARRTRRPGRRSPPERRSTRSSSSRPTPAPTARSAPRGSRVARRSRGGPSPSSRSTGSPDGPPAARARGPRQPLAAAGARPHGRRAGSRPSAAARPPIPAC